MSRFQRWLVVGSSVATAVTGVLYAWMKYLMEPADPWAVINHPLEPWILKAHVLAAPVMVFAFGVIAVNHVWKHFRCRVPVGRRSGLTAAALFFPAVLTGYLIQVVTHTGWLDALVVAHLATGGVYTAGLLAHRRLVGRNRRRGPHRPDDVRRGKAAAAPAGERPVVPGGSRRAKPAGGGGGDGARPPRRASRPGGDRGWSVARPPS